MASKQEMKAHKKDRTRPFANLGIFDLPDLDVMNDDNVSDIDESSLESELEAILSGETAIKPACPKNKVESSSLDVEKIAAECMEDIEDEDEDDDSLLTDPDLLKELKDLSCETSEEFISSSEGVERDTCMEISILKEDSPKSHPQGAFPGSIVAVLEERLNLYIHAIAAAKELNESSKIRRYTRAEKVLKELIKSAKAGKNINEEDIPPIVTVPKLKSRCHSKDHPEESCSSTLSTSDEVPTVIDVSNKTLYSETQKIDKINPIFADLVARRNAYKTAALKAKRAGDKNIAMSYMKTLKNLDAVIEAIKNGKEVNMSDIPDFPSFPAVITPVSNFPQKELHETEKSSTVEASALSAASEPEDPALFGAPPAPSSVLEALHQRLEKFKGTKESAEHEGNSNKVRRLDRIVKSYEKAIKDYEAGRPVIFEELPTPPGFAPIPVPEEHDKVKPCDTSRISKESEEFHASAKKHAPNASSKKAVPEVLPRRAAPELPKKTAEKQKSKVKRTNSTTAEKQLQFLLERQGMFRQAAISAKRKGDIEEAKHYLKQMKGFDKMIQASQCGLPVDMSSIPTPPQLESDFVIVDVEDCVEGDGTSLELLENLENDLTNQIEVCSRNKDHFLKLGDVAAASKFEKLGLESRKDLSVIRHLKKTGQSPPKFHYETRLFCIVQCNTNLSDSELEVTVVRGINFPGKPDDLDSYVRIDFPIPSDCPQKAKSKTVRDTNNPIFEEEFKFQINRKSRSQLRQFKRATLRLEVWSKGGFLRSDSLLGTVSVKLADLESRCFLHDSFELMDGRKNCGGKLEVKVRVRNPLLTDHVEKVKEKWLVIDA